MSDEELYRRYLSAKDNNALKALLERHREELVIFLYRILKNMEDAEDIMLDAYAVAASGTTKFSGKSSFKTWLFAIGRNLALKHIRKRHFLFIPLNEEVEVVESNEGRPDLEMLKTEKNQMLYDAMDRINPDYREALHLMYFESMEIDDISEVMGKNKKQVYNLINRGKIALKETLQSMGFDGGSNI